MSETKELNNKTTSLEDIFKNFPISKSMIQKERKKEFRSRIKERAYDVNLKNSQMPTYDPLADEHLQDYFNSPHTSKHLIKLGLIEEDGTIVEERVFKKKQIYLDKLAKETKFVNQQTNRVLDHEIEASCRRKVQTSFDRRLKLRKPGEKNPEFLVKYPISMQTTAIIYSDLSSTDRSKKKQKKIEPPFPQRSFLAENSGKAKTEYQSGKLETEDKLRYLSKNVAEKCVTIVVPEENTNREAPKRQIRPKSARPTRTSTFPVSSGFSEADSDNEEENNASINSEVLDDLAGESKNIILAKQANSVLPGRNTKQKQNYMSKNNEQNKSKIKRASADKPSVENIKNIKKVTLSSANGTEKSMAKSKIAKKLKTAPPQNSLKDQLQESNNLNRSLNDDFQSFTKICESSCNVEVEQTNDSPNLESKNSKTCIIEQHSQNIEAAKNYIDQNHFVNESNFSRSIDSDMYNQAKLTPLPNSSPDLELLILENEPITLHDDTPENDKHIKNSSTEEGHHQGMVVVTTLTFHQGSIGSLKNEKRGDSVDDEKVLIDNTVKIINHEVPRSTNSDDDLKRNLNINEENKNITFAQIESIHPALTKDQLKNLQNVEEAKNNIDQNHFVNESNFSRSIDSDMYNQAKLTPLPNSSPDLELLILENEPITLHDDTPENDKHIKNSSTEEGHHQGMVVVTTLTFHQGSIGSLKNEKRGDSVDDEKVLIDNTVKIINHEVPRSTNSDDDLKRNLNINEENKNITFAQIESIHPALTKDQLKNLQNVEEAKNNIDQNHFVNESNFSRSIDSDMYNQAKLTPLPNSSPDLELLILENEPITLHDDTPENDKHIKNSSTEEGHHQGMVVVTTLTFHQGSIGSLKNEKRGDSVDNEKVLIDNTVKIINHEVPRSTNSDNDLKRNLNINEENKNITFAQIESIHPALTKDQLKNLQNVEEAKNNIDQNHFVNESNFSRSIDSDMYNQAKLTPLPNSSPDLELLILENEPITLHDDTPENDKHIKNSSTEEGHHQGMVVVTTLTFHQGSIGSLKNEKRGDSVDDEKVLIDNTVKIINHEVPRSTNSDDDLKRNLNINEENKNITFTQNESLHATQTKDQLKVFKLDQSLNRPKSIRGAIGKSVMKGIAETEIP